MPVARSQTIDPHTCQIVHVWSRCVRRAFLCGYDRLLDQDFEYRREWVRSRMERLAGIYCIDIITFSVMHNHHHELLRTRPDVVATLSDEEVVRRWLRLNFKRYFFPDGSDRKSTKSEINKKINDRKQMKKLRQKLSDVSKFMQSLNQSIAIRANREDGYEGKFFEKRFGHEVLADTPEVLACNLYIDLNPIHAQIASTPEESEYTGAYERINDLRMFVMEQDGDLSINLSQRSSEFHDWERLGEAEGGWLSPLEIDERNDPIGPDVATNEKRASNKGSLPISLSKYLQLLDEVGRVVRSDKKGAIGKDLEPILDRIGVSEDGLLQTILGLMEKHSSYFSHTERSGRPDGVVKRATGEQARNSQRATQGKLAAGDQNAADAIPISTR